MRGTTLSQMAQALCRGTISESGGKIVIAGGLSGSRWAPQSPLILGRDIRARAIGFQKGLPRPIDSVWLPYKDQYTVTTHIDCR